MSDVGIVGGGPAGLATAIALRLRGLSVAVFDRAAPPIDKPCGEGIMPDGVELLARWGVALSPQESSRFVGIRFLESERVAEGCFPGGAGLAVRRTHLHTRMIERAERLGVELLWGERVEGIEPGVIRTGGGAHSCRYLIGADGLHSKVRAWSGLAAAPPAASAPRGRFGVRRHFACAPWSEHVEVYWAERCEAYVTGTGPDRVGVALLWSGEASSFDRLLTRFPELKARLGDAAAVSRDRGAGPLRQRVHDTVRGNVALVGDAAGYVDAITGEGLSLAFHEAEALADAICRGSLRGYPGAQRRLRRVPEAMTHLLLLAERHPKKRARFLRLIASHPQVFHLLLGIHSRQLPPQSLGAVGALRLAACLLA